MFITGLFSGFALGGCVGFILFAICCAAKKGDEYIGQDMN
jgi:hypothetical protein